MGYTRKIRQDDSRTNTPTLSTNSTNPPTSSTPATDSKRNPPKPFEHSNARQEKSVSSRRFGSPTRISIAETIDGSYTPPKRSHYYEYIYTVDDSEHLVLSLDGRRIFWAHGHEYYHGELLKALPVPLNETGSFCTLRQINAPENPILHPEDCTPPTETFADHIREKNNRVKKR